MFIYSPGFYQIRDARVLMYASVVHDDYRPLRHTLVHVVQQTLDERKEFPFGERSFNNFGVDHSGSRQGREKGVSWFTFQYNIVNR